MIKHEVVDAVPGVFYVIQLTPETSPEMIKLGYTTSIENRLKPFRTVCPAVRVVALWPCLQTWEQTAIDSMTDEMCEHMGGEVYRCRDLKFLLLRGDIFFSMLPNVDERILFRPTDDDMFFMLVETVCRYGMEAVEAKVKEVIQGGDRQQMESLSVTVQEIADVIKMEPSLEIRPSYRKRRMPVEIYAYMVRKGYMIEPEEVAQEPLDGWHL